MKKILLLAVSLILLLSGCSANNSVNGNTEVSNESVFAEGGFEFLDCRNREVILTKQPHKVISNDFSLTQLWELSGGKNIETVNTNNYQQADFAILYDGSTTSETKFPDAYALFKTNSFEDYLYTLKIFTKINSHPSLYDYYGEELQRNINNIIELCASYEKISVCLIDESGNEAEQDNFVYSILNDIAVVADKENAQTILVLPGGDAASYENAVELPEDLFSAAPNSRFAEAYNYIANILYNINGD